MTQKEAQKLRSPGATAPTPMKFHLKQDKKVVGWDGSEGTATASQQQMHKRIRCALSTKATAPIGKKRMHETQVKEIKGANSEGACTFQSGTSPWRHSHNICIKHSK